MAAQRPYGKYTEKDGNNIIGRVNQAEPHGQAHEPQARALTGMGGACTLSFWESVSREISGTELAQIRFSQPCSILTRHYNGGYSTPIS